MNKQFDNKKLNDFIDTFNTEMSREFFFRDKWDHISKKSYRISIDKHVITNSWDRDNYDYPRR